MNYKVVPFVAKLSQSDTTKAVADQLDALINDMSSQGWDYVRLENRIQELSFLGIETSFLSEKEAFDTMIKNHIQ